MNLLDLNQELRELGTSGALFRARWEIGNRVFPAAGRVPSWTETSPPRAQGAFWVSRLPFGDPVAVANAMRDRTPKPELDALRAGAEKALAGRVLCFSRWEADFGRPIDWHLNPQTGHRWDSQLGWSRVLASAPDGCDVKLTWEIARFPHAYRIARAAAYTPERAAAWGEALLEQIEQFAAHNPPWRGVHWASSQEVAFRLLAWLFALDLLFTRVPIRDRAAQIIGRALLSGALHIERNLDYARFVVYNNHLLSEAVALLGAGALLPESPRGQRWRTLGRRVLEEEAGRQFYRDGAYLQQSHNYHRVALQDLMWACAFTRSMGDAPSEIWLQAMERSLDFLVAHQNPADGGLPNYGANDGSLPSIVSTCDFSDFRPTLQAVSLLVRGERLYEAGPWDEEAAWFLGVKALDAPLRQVTRRSASFGMTGFHVLRGRAESSFCALRCGNLRERFSQIDMLHLDVWWRGLNVLVDGGSYLYSGPAKWHNHFMRTGSHNTVAIDGRDQMVHFRQFKVLYWTKAALLRFEDHPGWAICEGEHYGYQRHPGRAVHRRGVLYFKDDVWIVVDWILGWGNHHARLHWLCGEFDHRYDRQAGRVDLATGLGPFTIDVLNEEGTPMAGDVVAGQEDPPRGWLSRYYGEKMPVPSFAVEKTAGLPITFVSVLSGGPSSVTVANGRWLVAHGDSAIEFTIQGEQFGKVTLTPAQ